MNSPALNEIRDDIWHLLLHIDTYQEKSLRVLEISPTRYELASEIVGLNALADLITLRVARLADRSKGVRSIKNLAKTHPNLTEKLKNLVKEFEEKAKPVLTQRHEKIAHMKVGELSSYPLNPLNLETVLCIDILVNLFDEFSGQPVEYTCSVGSQERPVNLRQSVMVGKRVMV
jgi:hypothetical protein